MKTTDEISEASQDPTKHLEGVPLSEKWATNPTSSLNVYCIPNSPLSSYYSAIDIPLDDSNELISSDNHPIPVHEGKEVREDNHNPVPDNHWEDRELDWQPPTIRRPSNSIIRKLKSSAPELFNQELHINARDRYSLNWLSYEDHLLNWKVLSPEQKLNLISIAEGDWDEALWVGGGLKCGNGKDLTFPEALMLLTAVDIGEIVEGAGCKIVRGNIRKNGYYTMEKSSRRNLDPRAARSFNSSWIRKHDLEGLFPNYKGISVVFSLPEDLISVGSSLFEPRDRINEFFRMVHTVLVDLQKSKKSPLEAFILSNEISCRSIRRSQFNPHSHAILFVDRDEDFGFLDDLRAVGLNIKQRSEIITSANRLRNIITYISKATSLVEPYRREFSEEDLRDFNVMTMNAHHTLAALNSCGGWDGGKPPLNRKFLERGIPKR